MLNKDMKKNEKYKSSFEKPQPNSEPMLIELPSATLVQNAMLYEAMSIKFCQSNLKKLIGDNSP
jgi:hypothetical protein